MYDPKLFPEVEKERRKKISQYNLNVKYPNRLYRQKDWLYEQYVMKKRYLKDIAQDADTVDSTILVWVRRFNFPIITLSERHKDIKFWGKFNEAGRNREYPKGEKHPNYISVKSRNFKQIYNSVEFNLWKKAIHERDGYTCRGCNKKLGILDAHHILPVRNFPNLAYAIDNGISLCHSCHSKTIGKEFLFIVSFEKVANSVEPKDNGSLNGNAELNSEKSDKCVETIYDPRKG